MNLSAPINLLRSDSKNKEEIDGLVSAKTEILFQIQNHTRGTITQQDVPGFQIAHRSVWSINLTGTQHREPSTAFPFVRCTVTEFCWRATNGIDKNKTIFNITIYGLPGSKNYEMSTNNTVVKLKESKPSYVEGTPCLNGLNSFFCSINNQVHKSVKFYIQKMLS